MTMKKMSRILSVFLALALLCSLCAAFSVFAEEVSGSSEQTEGVVPQSTGSSSGGESTTPPEPEPDSLTGVTGVTYQSYAIGTGSGNGFTSTTSIPMYTTDLTIRVYFTYVLPIIVLVIFVMGYWDKFKDFFLALLG